MKTIFTIFATLIAVVASAQDIAPQEGVPQEVAPRKSIKERLSMPAQRDSLTVVNETVQISEQGDAATIIENGLKVAPRAINGYRIVIFMSNTQTARRDAVMAQENFSALFPQEQSYLTYENPYFKVAVGNCTSQEEAIILLGRLRSTFPKAFIMRENIEIGEFNR
ncbi:MAG: hypothetical protein IKA04_10765 [Alistipes sp.]|nr:hypothetical protein [Alistipes sp.]